MQASDVKEVFRQITAEHFADYNVVFSNQSRMVKPTTPLVTIAYGNVKRPQAQITIPSEVGVEGFYLSTMTATIDLFTNGSPIEEGGKVLAYENTAMDEMLDFADYLNSPVCVEQCCLNDISILIQTDAQDITGAVSDSNYAYRARLDVSLSFTQEVNVKYGAVGVFEDAAIDGEYTTS